MVELSEADRHWLSGLLEGEGSFMAGPPSSPGSPCVAVNMTDEDVVLRVAALFGVRYLHHRRGEAKGWKPSFSTRVRGTRAVALMRDLRPLMGGRRQSQIDRALASYVRPQRTPTPQTVDAIRESTGTPILTLSQIHGVTRKTIRKILAGEPVRMTA